MAKYVINKSTLTGIADAIRSKEGSTAAIPVPNMKERILNIKTGVDTSDATATEGDVVSPKTFYARGKKYTGNIPSKAAATITPGTTDVVISKNQYLAGDQTIKGDPDLKPENIKSGINIFGVLGTMSAGGGKIYTGTVDFSAVTNAAGMATEVSIGTGVEVSSNDTFIIMFHNTGGTMSDTTNKIVAAYHCPGTDATLADIGVVVYGTSNDGACVETNTVEFYFGANTPFGTSYDDVFIIAPWGYYTPELEFAHDMYRWFLIKGEVVS